MITFRGHGFSIHNSVDFKIVTTVVGKIELVTRQHYSSINTAYLDGSSTPSSDAEAT